MDPAILNYVLNGLIPFAIGIGLRFATRNRQKPLLVALCFILLIGALLLLFFYKAYHTLALDTTELIILGSIVVGTLLADLILRIRGR